MKIGIYLVSPNRKTYSRLTKNMPDDTEVICDGTFFWFGENGIPVNSLTIAKKEYIRDIGEGKNWKPLTMSKNSFSFFDGLFD